MGDLYLGLVLSKLSTNSKHYALTQEAQNTISSIPVSLQVKQAQDSSAALKSTGMVQPMFIT